MDKDKFEPDRKLDGPDKLFSEELKNKGDLLSDIPTVADARDKAKI